MHSLPYVQTSVFIDDRYSFGGNQLATFWDAKINEVLNTELMQGIALELNFSETTFLSEPQNKECASKVRIFTPARELSFAGHPTIGTAFVMKHKELLKPNTNETILELGVGPIPVEYVEEAVVRMKQNKPEFLNTWNDKWAMSETIGINPEDISDVGPIQWVSTGNPFLIVPLKNLEALERAIPNTGKILETFEHHSSRQILILCTEPVNEDSHVHVRMFAPELGVVEDPATGSAAGPLAAYMERYNLLGREKTGEEIVIEQGYEMNRPSRLVAQVIGDEVYENVLVSGKTKLIAEGVFYIDE
ncbi:MAG: PhzF family phenazine biosynthesis protein [Candidatus Thorarchaeota archaeon]|jgi:trans-2,3-dihydro-3-hydroxyanthranilate isomerase